MHSLLLARAIFAASVVLISTQLSAAEGGGNEVTQATSPCKTQQMIRCAAGPRTLSAALPDDAPRSGAVITVDVASQTLYLFDDGALVAQAHVGTGTDRVLKQGSRIWLFRTPRGRHTVLRKITDPIWNKPDWAFVEEGKQVPPPDSPLRRVKGKMGRYALDLGDGILIHGTDDPTSFGRKASHGCIRVPDRMLTRLYASAKIGTAVYIYDSARAAVTREVHSDLDYPGTRLVVGEK